MANENNLRPFSSREQAQELGRKGGIASAKARRERRKLREELLEMLSLPVEELEGMTEQRAILAAMLKKARGGDVSATAFIRDTIGEKPTDKLEHSGSLDLARELAEARKRAGS